MGISGGTFDQDGKYMRYTGCGKSDITFMRDHPIYKLGKKSSLCYEGFVGINGGYEKTLIGTDGKTFNKLGQYNVFGEAGITLGSIRDTNWDKGAETRFNVSVFGGTKCGAKMNLTGKTAIGGDAYTRLCLKGDMYGEYAHSLKNDNFIDSLPDGFENTQPKLSTITAGANAGLEIDATAQRLQVDVMAGPEFQYNTANFGDKICEYKNGALKACLAAEYVAHLPKNSKVGLILLGNLGMKIPVFVEKDGQDQIKVSGITDASNADLYFNLGAKLVW